MPMHLLSSLFAKDNFKSLKHHMEKTMSCVELSRQLFEALFLNQSTEVLALTKHISQIEHQCDLIKQQIRTSLEETTLLPVDKRDLIHVLYHMDCIADYTEDVGVLLTLRPMQLDAKLQPHFWSFYEAVYGVVQQASLLINSFDQLLEAGFEGPDAQLVLKQIIEIERLEHLADKAQDQFGKILFQHEDEMKPAALFMWIKIANKLGDLANASEKMAHHIRFMLV